MGCLNIYQDNYADATIVSNRFIDEYMAEANDAQLKIYLYLLRMKSTGLPQGISGIADTFNHTEKDVVRALKYWEKYHVLSLEYDEDKNICGIRLLDLSAKAASGISGESAPADGSPRASVVTLRSRTGEARLSSAAGAAVSTVKRSAAASSSAASAASPTAASAAASVTAAAPAASSGAFTRPSYSLDELKAFQEKDSTAQLLFIAEQYLGRPLSPADMKSILFFSDGLHFSDDLIDYLLQYCIERGKKDFRYIEKVAVSWAEAHVTTPAEAESQSSKYDKAVYTIMNALGKTTSPTRREADFIRRWREEYAFETDIIVEACERTVLATDRHRFEYADKILVSWRDAGVHHKADIARLDEGFQKERPGRQGPVRAADKYNRFMQNSYDYEALEQELLRN